MNIKIRKAKTGDEKILAFIQTESWKNSFKGIISETDLEKYTNITKAEEMYSRVLKEKYAENFILEIDGKPHCIAAWSKARNSEFSDSAELICIHSLCDNWGKGYGSIMMNHIINEIKSAGFKSVLLWVFEKNIRARKFYEKHGFVSEGGRPKFYEAPVEDALIMWKR